MQSATNSTDFRTARHRSIEINSTHEDVTETLYYLTKVKSQNIQMYISHTLRVTHACPFT